MLQALALVGAILIGAVILIWVQRWRKAPPDCTPSANDQLAHFRELYEDGEITLSEYERIRAKLDAQFRQEAGLPPKVSSDAPEPPPPAPQDLPPSGV